MTHLATYARAALRRGSTTRIMPCTPASNNMPGTSVDLPDPVGAFSNTRARSLEETAARNESAISKTGNDTHEDVDGNAES